MRTPTIVKDLAVDHRSVAIIPSNNLDASEDFYSRLGFDVVSDYGHYRILADSRGWHLHLTHAPGWPKNIEDNPFGLYLYVDDVDAVAARVARHIDADVHSHRLDGGAAASERLAHDNGDHLHDQRIG